MLDEDAFLKAFDICPANGLREAIEVYLSALPKPEAPYEQAILYRKLVGMDD